MTEVSSPPTNLPQNASERFAAIVQNLPPGHPEINSLKTATEIMEDPTDTTLTPEQKVSLTTQMKQELNETAIEPDPNKGVAQQYKEHVIPELDRKKMQEQRAYLAYERGIYNVSDEELSTIYLHQIENADELDSLFTQVDAMIHEKKGDEQVLAAARKRVLEIYGYGSMPVEDQQKLLLHYYLDWKHRNQDDNAFIHQAPIRQQNPSVDHPEEFRTKEKDTSTQVDQIYYTWATKGLNEISAGFRVRAATERMLARNEYEKVDRYLRYILPSTESTDPFDARFHLTDAPKNLTLVTLDDGRRVLVHKVYTGRDLVGRYGNFFAHGLVGLPQEFSSLDAVSLWDSPFWQRQNIEDIPNNTLESTTVNKLKSSEQQTFDIQAVREYLPYIIEAYLTKSPGFPMNIVAPDEQVATLLYCLIRSLPPALTKNVTFSTYEHPREEIVDQNPISGRVILPEIVGTSWMKYDLHDKSGQWRDLPDICYQTALTVNCLNGKRTQLPEKGDNPARAFAQFATACLVRNDVMTLDLFLSRAQNTQTIQQFLHYILPK